MFGGAATGPQPVLSAPDRNRVRAQASRRQGASLERSYGYVGWYSNRARGELAKALKAPQPAKTPLEAEVPASEIAISAKAT